MRPKIRSVLASFALITATCTLIGCATAPLSAPNPTKAMEMEVSWADSYRSIDALTARADLIVEGTVDSTDPLPELDGIASNTSKDDRKQSPQRYTARIDGRLVLPQESQIQEITGVDTIQRLELFIQERGTSGE